jgi:hypothetical protein
MIKVFVAHDPLEAHFVKSLLELEGIAAEVQGESLFGLRPGVGIASDTLPSVWIVEDLRVDKSRQVIADYERQKRDALPDSD